MPVILAGLEEHAVARANYLYRAATALREADTFADVDGLAVGVGVPSGSRARVKWTLAAPRREDPDGAATVSM